MIIVQASVAALYSITRHMTFKTSIFDIGDFEQILFNLLVGRGLTTTIAPPFVEQSWLAVHFSPIMYAVAPLYALFPYTNTLLILHSCLIALAAWPIFLAARQILCCEKKALVVAFLYLIHPCVLNAGIWDFHEIAFAPLAIGFGLLAVLQRRRFLLLFCCIVLLATKEHYGLAVFGFAVLWYTQTRELRFSAILACIGVTSLVLILGVIMPALNPNNMHFMLTADGSAADRYSWLLRLASQGAELEALIVSSLLYLLLLLAPLGFLPLASMVWLFPAVADIAANTLSSNPFMRSFSAYHSAAIAPALLVATCMAYQRLIWRDKLITSLIVVAVSLYIAYVFSCLPLSGAANPWEFERLQLSYSRDDATAIDDIAALIGSASVSAQVNVGGHFGRRQQLYLFPEANQTTSFVLLRPASPFNTSDDILGISTRELMRKMDEIKQRGYREIYNKHGWIVLSNE